MNHLMLQKIEMIPLCSPYVNSYNYELGILIP